MLRQINSDALWRCNRSSVTGNAVDLEMRGMMIGVMGAACLVPQADKHSSNSIRACTVDSKERGYRAGVAGTCLWHSLAQGTAWRS